VDEGGCSDLGLFCKFNVQGSRFKIQAIAARTLTPKCKVAGAKFKVFFGERKLSGGELGGRSRMGWGGGGLEILSHEKNLFFLTFINLH